MAYQSLYRRYRPQRFSELRGQDHVSTTLRNAVRTGRVAHAYLFSGPRGTGKTSTARILAKALNCPDVVDGEPCGVCGSCTGIAEGRSLDVAELDAASNRGIDAMRDLIARTSLASPGRWKVYILDEVHMLTADASNALLKTLESPPAHVVFVLATTEPHKVLPTVASRAQHFEFRLLPVDVLVDHLRWVVADAGLEVAPEAVELVARRGSGSARDALSALDQVAAAGGIHEDTGSLDDLVEALCERDLERALTAVAERCSAGHSPRQLASALLEHLRQAFLATVARGLVSLPDDEADRVAGQARRLGRAGTVRAMEVLGQALVDMRDAPEPRVLLEVAVVRLCRPETDPSLAALVERVEKLERALASGTGVAGTGAGETTPTSKPAEPSPLGATRQALGALRHAASPPHPTARGAGPPATAASNEPERRPPGGAGGSSVTPERPAASGTPTRDEVTLAWADAVLPRLSQRARARFRIGRFVDAGGAIGFALPNAIHRDRCRDVLPEVAAALAAHFGRPVALELVVESEVGQPKPAAAAEEDDLDLGDPDELRDAHPSAVTSPVDRLLATFEGATVVEE